MMPRKENLYFNIDDQTLNTWLLYLHSERATAIDFRETPAASNKALTMGDFQHLMHEWKLRGMT